jgi:Ca2+-binding RTX toxin-like protein
VGEWNSADGDVLTGIENLVGTTFADILIGDAGDNRLAGGLGSDRLNGGAGNDTADYSGDAGAVRIDLSIGSGQWNSAEGDVLTSIENVVGTAFNDVLIGDSGINALFGGAGDDRLNGGFGGDQLQGGAGIDTVDYSTEFGGVHVNLATGVGEWNSADGDVLTGIENLVGTTFADILIGDAGDNRLNGGFGGDQLHGGAGIDTVDYSTEFGGVHVNLATGVGEWNSAHGDVLTGIENLVGTTFADILIGDAGDNRLAGGLGADQLNGGAGNDTAVYSGSRAAYTVVVFGGVTTVSGPDGTDTLTNVERLQFADGLYDISGNPAAAQPAATPEVLPALAADKSSEGREVLPAASGDVAKDGGAEVLPAMSDDGSKADGPQVLPGANDLTEPVRGEWVGTDFVPPSGNLADTAFLFDGSANDGYLVFATNDDVAPEVLPAIADDFLLTAKFEGPPVMPPADVDFDVAGLVKEIEFARGLLFSGAGSSPNPNVSADGLTVYEDWSAFAPPTRDDVWS